MNTKTIVGTTKNNKSVYLDEESTHAHTHVSDTPNLLDYTKEALAHVIAIDDVVYVEVDLGRPLGKSDLVATDENDEIIYAKRVNRDTFTRFVKNRKQLEDSRIAVVLHKTDDEYRLFSTWIGPATPPFPRENPKHDQESIEFWKKHALVWGRQAIQPGTEVTEWPWGKTT
jgi:hypothetical protein